MIRLRDVADTPLKWQKSSFTRRTYELKAGDDLVATLEFKDRLNLNAEGISLEGKWDFIHKGIFNMSVHVTDAGSGNELAVLNRRNGILELSYGRQYKWVKADSWGTKWAFDSENDERLVSFTSADGLENLFKNTTRVELSPAAIKMSEAPLLVTLGLYVMLVIQYERAVATGAGAV